MSGCRARYGGIWWRCQEPRFHRGPHLAYRGGFTFMWARHEWLRQLRAKVGV